MSVSIPTRYGPLVPTLGDDLNDEIKKKNFLKKATEWLQLSVSLIAESSIGLPGMRMACD